MYVVMWLLKTSFPKFLLATLLSIASGMMAVGVLIVLFHALGPSNRVELWLFSVLSLGAVIGRTASRLMVGSIGRDAVSELRADLCRRISSVPLVDLERIGPSRLMTALTDDTGRVAAVIPNLTILFTNLSLIVGCLAYLTWLSVVQLLMTLVVVAIGILCHAILRRKGIKQLRITRQRSDQIAETAATLIRGAKELKLNLEQRKSVLAQLTHNTSCWSASAGKQSTVFTGSQAITQALFYVALGVAMFGFADGTLDRHSMASYGIAVAFLMAPLQNSVQTIEALSDASLSLSRVKELGLLLGDRWERADSAAIGAGERAIDLHELELCDISFVYPPALSNEQLGFHVGPINLALQKGEVLFVVGGNGSGKTTFIKLLTGLYPLQTGVFRINGQRVCNPDSPLYRSLFAAIFHDTFLFDNLSQADFERLRGLLIRFGMNERVHAEPGKLHGIAKLSSGERKRLALVLAYLDNRPIFVFDEWAADQEPRFKELFYHDILQELRSLGKFVIVVSHDDRYFHLADKILKFERGVTPRYELLRQSANE
ncbi:MULTISPECIES: cyclic peptide export ABC transporter [unclassified Bradyrhizobium]|uniref:cyclic peptide export ABC transporter n=1 Tax=unclassified Bradyrhizobium TaxID=2631580 RepID=UPI0029167D93|nr:MULTISPECIES: cyclic peptide export ABC transporter [unclassified Bradyrhizobium]